MPLTYRCLACGLTVEMAEGDEFPRDSERCSHEFEPLAVAEPQPLTPTQRHILAHFRADRCDPAREILAQISLYNLRCLVGMMQTGEATLADFQAVGGKPLVDCLMAMAEKWRA